MREFRLLFPAILACVAIQCGGFGCTSAPRAGEFFEPYDFGFRGPGRLLLILENAENESALVVSDAQGARRQDVERPRDARWITPKALFVLSEEAPEEFRLPQTFMLQVPLDAGPNAGRVIDGPRRHYDPEPSPNGEWLAIGVDVEGVGESDLEIWALGEGFERIASRAQALDEPRWSPDGHTLVASHPIPDPIGSEDSLGGGFGGISFAWPRLFRLRRDLGTPTLLHDAETPGQFAVGGSLPLWWAAEGIYARQRIGLVLCAPERGTCTRVYAPGSERRVVDGRPIFSRTPNSTERREALVLVAREESPRLYPTEIHRIDLDTGEGEVVFRVPEDTVILDIDWIETN